MRQLIHSIDEAVSSLRYLAAQRRRLGVWVVAAQSPSALLMINALVKEHKCAGVDLLTELLTELTDDSEKPLGVFSPDDLADWMERISFEVPPRSTILISEVEPILATFTKPGAISFFRLAARLGVRNPIVIISHLGEIVRAAGFPEPRVWEVVD